jgi:hypothetical protein
MIYLHPRFNIISLNGPLVFTIAIYISCRGQFFVLESKTKIESGKKLHISRIFYTVHLRSLKYVVKIRYISDFKTSRICHVVII